LEIVVAHFNEDLSWLSLIPESWRITVYAKGDVPSLDRGEVIALPNVGRDSHTILHHCANRYDRLSHYTLFVQGNPFDHRRDFANHIRTLEKVEREGQLRYVPVGDQYFRLKNEFYDGTFTPIVPYIVELRLPTPVLDGSKAFVYGAQALVREDAIRTRSREWYEQAEKYSTQEPGYRYAVFEYLWPLIWNSEVIV
jgi:hypothetical protein